MFGYVFFFFWVAILRHQSLFELEVFLRMPDQLVQHLVGHELSGPVVRNGNHLVEQMNEMLVMGIDYRMSGFQPAVPVYPLHSHRFRSRILPDIPGPLGRCDDDSKSPWLRAAFYRLSVGKGKEYDPPAGGSSRRAMS